MKKLTYKEAYNKIIDAYFKDEIKPYNEEFCFCGTLLNNDRDWWENVHHNMKGFGDYSYLELYEMEKALLIPLMTLAGRRYKTNYLLIDGDRDRVEGSELFEDRLFEGMQSALDVLKQIHKDRGESVDEETTFTKRVLTT